VSSFGYLSAHQKGDKNLKLNKTSTTKNLGNNGNDQSKHQTNNQNHSKTSVYKPKTACL